MIGEKACAAHGFDKAAEFLNFELREGDLAVIMGAGDVWHTFEYMNLE